MMKRLIKTLCLCGVFLMGGAFRGVAEIEDSEHHASVGERIACALEGKRGESACRDWRDINTCLIVELRGAVPVGHILYETGKMTKSERIKKSLWIYMLAVIGNMLPVPFILLLLGPFSELMMRFPPGKKVVDWLFERTRRKSANIEKYEELGLTIFCGGSTACDRGKDRSDGGISDGIALLEIDVVHFAGRYDCRDYNDHRFADGMAGRAGCRCSIACISRKCCFKKFK